MTQIYSFFFEGVKNYQKQNDVGFQKWVENHFFFFFFSRKGKVGEKLYAKIVYTWLF